MWWQSKTGELQRKIFSVVFYAKSVVFYNRLVVFYAI